MLKEAVKRLASKQTLDYIKEHASLLSFSWTLGRARELYSITIFFYKPL